MPSVREDPFSRYCGSGEYCLHLSHCEDQSNQMLNSSECQIALYELKNKGFHAKMFDCQQYALAVWIDGLYTMKDIQMLLSPLGIEVAYFNRIHGNLYGAERIQSDA